MAEKNGDGKGKPPSTAAEALKSLKLGDVSEMAKTRVGHDRLGFKPWETVATRSLY